MLQEIGRRELLRNVALLVGATALSEAGAQAMFGGRESLPSPTIGLLAAVADTIIPTTDTPGAAGAGVPAMFDKLLANWASAKRRSEILAALQAIDIDTQRVTGGSFADLPSQRRFELLSSYDGAHALDPAYAKLKELIVTLYYMSEIGSTVELRYEHSPGAWEPSIPITPETRNYGGAAGL